MPKQDDGRIDWSGVGGDATAKMRAAIVRYVRGYRGGGRKTPVTEQQILRQFRSTPEEFVKAALLEAEDLGEVEPSYRSALGASRARGVRVYEVPEAGEREGAPKG
jgi:hypothetical protein